MGKKDFRKGLIFGAIIMAIVFSAITSGSGLIKSLIYGSANENYLSLDTNEISNKMEVLEELINTYYFGEIDQEQVENYIYKGMVSGLADRYANYYSAEEYEEYKTQTKGLYMGIGIVISVKEDGTNVIQSVYDNSPAKEAGILAGDSIMEVDGVSTEEMTPTEVSKAIKGSASETVVLKIYRESDGQYHTIEAVKKDIEIETVKHEIKEDNIGYIQVTSFEEKTLSQFETALSYMEEKNVSGLIIDMRDNPGGLVDSVCDMLDVLLPEGVLVYTENKNGSRTDYESDEACRLAEVPMVVLTNENSASASEIFAGAIKDYERGTLVGTKTYGKGIVQNIIALKDKTALKITVAKYFTPKGNYIHDIGIEPDIYVENKDDGKDIQLETAIKTIKDKLGN